MIVHGNRAGLRPKVARRSSRLRRGLAALEVVLAAGITIPILAFLLYAGIRVCRFFFSLAGTMIGSPYM